MKIEKILKEAVSVLLNEYDKQQEEIKRYKIIIEKQQKEIQKLEARKYMFNAETGEITQIPIDNNYINKNKIKEKIEELNNNRQYLSQFKDYKEKDYTNEEVVNNCVEVLQELLEIE
jgi:hypothetical protein